MADSPRIALSLLKLRALDVALNELVASQSDPVLRGTVLHPWSGLEVLSVGSAAARREGDVVFGTHRGLGHCLAWGADPRRTLAEALGRETGFAYGRGGHMHIVDPASGIGGTNGIVGGGIPLGVGAALAMQVRESGNAVAVFIGDGATNTGSFHESLNLAAVWRLPLVIFCEDNDMTEAMRSSSQRASQSLVTRGEAYGIPSLEVPGDDLKAIHGTALAALERARGGGGPSFVVCRVTRPGGHYAGDRQHYRGKEEAARAALDDPVPRAIDMLDLGQDVRSRLEEEARRFADELLASVLAELPPSLDLLLLGSEDSAAPIGGAR